MYQDNLTLLKESFISLKAAYKTAENKVLPKILDENRTFFFDIGTVLS